MPGASQFDLGNDSYLAIAAIGMNPQSNGSVKLRSADPNDPPLIDLNCLAHPYDRRVMIEGLRLALRFRRTPLLAKFYKGDILAPISDSDEDLWKFIGATAATVWHGNGTVRMGKDGDADTCVDVDFKVRGVGNLRVADLSVCPLTPK